MARNLVKEWMAFAYCDLESIKYRQNRIIKMKKTKALSFWLYAFSSYQR
jgi:hypothetical protein